MKRDAKMSSCKCEKFIVDVHRASYVKHFRNEKTLKKIKTKRNDYTIVVTSRTY